MGVPENYIGDSYFRHGKPLCALENLSLVVLFDI